MTRVQVRKTTRTTTQPDIDKRTPSGRDLPF